MIKKYCMPGQILAILMLFFNVSISVAEEANLLPPPQVAVSPSVIETVLGNKPSNEVIHVYNLGDKPLTISTTVAHWDTNKNNQVRVIPPTEQSLDQWIIINPLSFTIPAGLLSCNVRAGLLSATVPTGLLSATVPGGL